MYVMHSWKWSPRGYVPSAGSFACSHMFSRNTLSFRVSPRVTGTWCQAVNFQKRVVPDDP